MNYIISKQILHGLYYILFNIEEKKERNAIDSGFVGGPRDMRIESISPLANLGMPLTDTIERSQPSHKSV